MVWLIRYAFLALILVCVVSLFGLVAPDARASDRRHHLYIGAVVVACAVVCILFQALVPTDFKAVGEGNEVMETHSLATLKTGSHLSGMNAEKRNLITGTRYMNVEGMLPYETKVSDFIFAGGGRVYYKVTPDFRSGELVARGVRIQAYSLADKGKSINFDVYCYNVQPGYKINYATGEATKID